MQPLKWFKLGQFLGMSSKWREEEAHFTILVLELRKHESRFFLNWETSNKD